MPEAASGPAAPEAAPAAAPEAAPAAAPAAAPEAAPEAAPAAPGPQGGNWRDNLPDEVKASESLSKFGSVEDLSKAYINLEKHTGNAIRIPGEDASDEARADFLDKLQKNAPNLIVKPDPDNADQMAEFYQTVGRPKDANGYETPVFNGEDGEPLELDMSQAEAFKEVALGANLTKEQYQKIVENMTASNLQAETQQHEAFVGQAKALRDEWGHAYDERYRAAADIAAKTGAPEQLQDMFQSGWVDAQTIAYFYNLSQRFAGEGPEIGGQEGGQAVANAPVEARAKISEILENKQHAYWDSHHPDHKAAIQKMVALQKEANPQASTDINDLRAGGMGGLS